MPEVIELEFHSKDVSDFQMSRLVRASLRKYTVPIRAFISDALIADDTCLGVSFDHSYASGQVIYPTPQSQDMVCT